MLYFLPQKYKHFVSWDLMPHFLLFNSVSSVIFDFESFSFLLFSTIIFRSLFQTTPRIKQIFFFLFYEINKIFFIIIIKTWSVFNKILFLIITNQISNSFFLPSITKFFVQLLFPKREHKNGTELRYIKENKEG